MLNATTRYRWLRLAGLSILLVQTHAPANARCRKNVVVRSFVFF